MAKRQLEDDMAHARLDEFEKEEWWDVCRYLRPDMPRERFDKDWDDFHERKAEVLRNRSRN